MGTGTGLQAKLAAPLQAETGAFELIGSSRPPLEAWVVGPFASVFPTPDRAGTPRPAPPAHIEAPAGPPAPPRARKPPRTAATQSPPPPGGVPPNGRPPLRFFHCRYRVNRKNSTNASMTRSKIRSELSPPLGAGRALLPASASSITRLAM